VGARVEPSEGQGAMGITFNQNIEVKGMMRGLDLWDGEREFAILLLGNRNLHFNVGKF